MASVQMSKRTHCAGCGYSLLGLDGDSDHCTECRRAQAKGRTAWGKRMLLVRKMRARGEVSVLAENPFAGFSDEQMWRE